MTGRRKILLTIVALALTGNVVFALYVSGSQQPEHTYKIYDHGLWLGCYSDDIGCDKKGRRIDIVKFDGRVWSLNGRPIDGPTEAIGIHPDTGSSSVVCSLKIELDGHGLEILDDALQQAFASGAIDVWVLNLDPFPGLEPAELPNFDGGPDSWRRCAALKKARGIQD